MTEHFNVRTTASELPQHDSLAPIENPLRQQAIEGAYVARSPETHTQRTTDFITSALRLFDRLDSDHDGKLSRSELAKAVEDPSIKGQDAKVLAALYLGQINLWLSRDGGHDSNYAAWRGYKITREDIQRFNQIEAAHQSRVATLKSAVWNNQQFFDKIDRNHDGRFSAAELKDAQHDDALYEDQKQIVRLLAKYPRLAEDSRLSIDDFLLAFDHNGEEKTWNAVNRALSRAEYNERGASFSLYADGNDPLKSIKPEAVRQGNIGDCYFLAAAAEIAKLNPASIRDMIKDNKNGTYTVFFPGAKDEPVTISKPTDTEQYLYNGMSPYGQWASVLEKAYGKYCKDHFWHRYWMNPGGGYTTVEGADGGAWWRGLEMLTGKRAVEDDLAKLPPETIAKHLQEALTDKPPRMVLAASPLHRFDTDFLPAHMYSVEKFDPNGRDGGTVTLRNPHGSPLEETYGAVTYDISLKEYRECFYKQAISSR